MDDGTDRLSAYTDEEMSKNATYIMKWLEDWISDVNELKQYCEDDQDTYDVLSGDD